MAIATGNRKESASVETIDHSSTAQEIRDAIWGVESTSNVPFPIHISLDLGLGFLEVVI